MLDRLEKYWKFQLVRICDLNAIFGLLGLYENKKGETWVHNYAIYSSPLVVFILLEAFLPLVV